MGPRPRIRPLLRVQVRTEELSDGARGVGVVVVVVEKGECSTSGSMRNVVDDESRRSGNAEGGFFYRQQRDNYSTRCP